MSSGVKVAAVCPKRDKCFSYRSNAYCYECVMLVLSRQSRTPIYNIEIQSLEKKY